MLELIRPRAFVPVHGTLHHLTRHAELARNHGIGQVQVIENGSTLRLKDGHLSSMDPVPSGKIPIDIGGQPLEAETLATRIDLGRHGIVFVSLVIAEGGNLAVPPAVTLQGIAVLTDRDATIRAICLELARAVRRHFKRHDPIQEELRRLVRRVVLERTGCRPSVDIHVVYLE